MNKNHLPSRNDLLSQDTKNPLQQNNFSREVKKMYSEKLKTGQRILFVLAGVLTAVFALLFWAFSKMFEELQIKYELASMEPLRLIFTWAMFLSIALIAMCLWPAIRGKVGLRFYSKSPRIFAWLIILSLFMVAIASFEFIRLSEAVQALDISWVFAIMSLWLIAGVFFLLSERLDRSEIHTKRQILELRSHIVELEEKIAAGNPVKTD